MSGNRKQSRRIIDRFDFLSELPEHSLDILCAQASREYLMAGEVLFEQNETADVMCVVMSGALGVFVDQTQSTRKRLVALVGKGEVIGEVGIVAGGVRTANVIALRDTDLLRITRSQFEDLVANHPEIAVPITKILATRLRNTIESAAVNVRPKVISFIAASKNVDVVEIARKIEGTVEQKFNQSVFIQENEGTILDSKKLNDLEDAHDLVILCSANKDKDWMHACTRQSDRICLIVDSMSDISAELSEGFLRIAHDHQMVDLFILHDNKDVCPRLTQNALDKIKVNRHFHIRTTEQEDWNRWSRVINGRGVGLVLSGGGARAYAHLGVIRALKEANIPIDYVAGSSMGGIIASSIAMGWDVNTMEERIRECFVATNPLSDYTFPLQGLVRGRKVERLLKETFGSMQISDLWLPFFCVSTNLSNASGHIHDKGDLSDALRASISLPGILPPVSTPDGVLVDGGVINNLPVIEISKNCHGPIIAVDISRELSLSPKIWNEQVKQPLWRRMLRPPIVSLLLRSGTVSGEWQDKQQSDAAHVNLIPPLGEVDIRDWKIYEDTIELGYKYTVEQLEANPQLAELSEVPI